MRPMLHRQRDDAKSRIGAEVYGGLERVPYRTDGRAQYG